MTKKISSTKLCGRNSKIYNGAFLKYFSIVSTKIYDKRDDFNFDIVNFQFLDGDVPQRPSYVVYISQLIRFARASSHVTDFNNRNKFLTAKRLKQGYRYHKLRKAFSKFYRRHFELIEKYHVSLKNLCNKVFVIQNFMEIWYINLRKSLEIQTSLIFQTYSKSFQESRVFLRHYAANCMPSFYPIMVEGYAALFSCTAVVQASDSMTASI